MPLEPGKALVVIVAEDQSVENRVIAIPPGLPPSALTEASNYLNTHIRGLTIAEARAASRSRLRAAKAELDQLTKKVVEAGLATWSGGGDDRKSLLVRGQSNLLKDVSGLEELERIRQLFDDLETKRELIQLLGARRNRRGRAHLHRLGEQAVLAVGLVARRRPVPRSDQRRVVGVLGVIGPTRLNYARIIPMVDYTAQAGRPPDYMSLRNRDVIPWQ